MMALYFSVLVIFGALALLHPQPWWRVGYLTTLSLTALILGVVAMGTPRPGWTRWGPMTIIAAEYDPGKSIYVWARGEAPIAYRLPWSEETVKQIEKAFRTAKEQGQGAIRLVPQGDAYGDWSAHPPPVPRSEFKQ